MAPGDIVGLKGDSHEWLIKSFPLALGTHVREAFLEVVGEAWVRTKMVPIADLIAIPEKEKDPQPSRMAGG